MKEFPTTWNGAEFRFPSAANRGAFNKYPEAYAPQYGGCCAWAVSQGHTAKGDAELCKNRRWETVSLLQQFGAKKWEGGIPGFIASANTHWPELINWIFADLARAAMEGLSPAPFQFGVRVGASGWAPRLSQETRTRGV